MLTGDRVAELVEGELEVVDDLVERRGERLVILVREDVVDPRVLEEVLLQEAKEDETCWIGIFLVHMIHKVNRQIHTV